MTFNPATRKQTDKLFEKHMKLAKGWFQKGFTTEQIAHGLWNQIGYRCESHSDTEISVYRIYNDESKGHTEIVNLA